ncbi:hypothetical protein FBF31_02300 [Candidatus Saccharibacteria bacterium oral taxon 955]|nr:hypothetical protein FBF33_02290 [Candidatus Saccharibacteria bacterium oral taxon 955]QJU05899.1 hypothetical protein FBF31_02300 [Candidatus Saccharibacteria bacterium oral taxon 955]
MSALYGIVLALLAVSTSIVMIGSAKLSFDMFWMVRSHIIPMSEEDTYSIQATAWRHVATVGGTLVVLALISMSWLSGTLIPVVGMIVGGTLYIVGREGHFVMERKRT